MVYVTSREFGSPNDGKCYVQSPFDAALHRESTKGHPGNGLSKRPRASGNGTGEEPNGDQGRLILPPPTAAGTPVVEGQEVGRPALTRAAR